MSVKENIRQIKGNASEKLKDLARSTFLVFLDTKGNSFGVEVGRRLRLKEINISGVESPGSSYGPDADFEEKQRLGNEVSVETVFEITVERGEI
jgi:hypothetical protein